MNHQFQNLNALQEAIELLHASGLYQILSKLQPRDEFNPDDGSQKKMLMVIDTETTGLDFKEHKIFEIGYLLVEYSPETGKMFRVLSRYNGLEDPGEPLSEEIMKITGVTDADLAGQSFDLVRIREDIAKADMVLAHNSGFDRKFLEKEFSELKAKPWVCSMANAPWQKMAVGTKKLEYIAFKVANIFYEAHRALTDVEAVTEVLSREGVDGKPILKSILEKGGEASYVVWANNSPFETKDILKANGYRWCGEPAEDEFKAWYKEGVTDPDQELAFLAEIYPRAAKINIDMILPEDAFSTRYSERALFDVVPTKKAGFKP